MRTFLSELGCLPVSAMMHLPKAHDVFTQDGAYEEGQSESDWERYFERSFSQLIWWAEACRAQRDKVQLGDSFNKEPSQRNAPA